MVLEIAAETDVLIIGSGIAGIRAAIEASDLGANVVLSNKGVLGKDGAAVWMAASGYQAALYPPDSLEQHVKDTITAGKFLNNQDLLYHLLELAPQTVNDLYKWGVNYGREKGRFAQIALPGETYPRSLRHSSLGRHSGGEYRKALPRQIRLRERVRVLDDMFVVDLLKHGSTVVGALALDVREGELKVLKAKSTLLATGGFMQCFEFTTASPTLTGDGHAMAYRAGAKIMDMEFTQFFPAAAIWPSVIRGWAFPYSLLALLHGHFYNRLGERFMERYYPIEKDFATREATSRAIFKEVRAGRGSPHGGAYLSMRHLPRNLIENALEFIANDPPLLALREAGIDLREDALEVGPAAHYVQGGCWIDTNCQTSLSGLYAIGEIGSGGKDGADRLAGNSLPLCMAMGYIAGKEAATRAKEIAKPQIDWSQVRKLVDQALAPIERSDGIHPREVSESIRRLMSNHMVFARTGEQLTTALSELQRIRTEMLLKLFVPSKERKFNLIWVKALEARNMVDVAEMAVSAALMRTESRGLHERDDYPDESPDWLRHIIIERAGNGMSLKTDPVTFPYLKPDQK